MKKLPFFNTLLLSVFLCISYNSQAADQFVDFSKAVIYAPGSKGSDWEIAVRVLQEEIVSRSGLNLSVEDHSSFNKVGPPVVILLREENQNNLSEEDREELNRMLKTGKDGFKVLYRKSTNRLIVQGHDSRGLLYGVGYVLRKMELRRGEIKVPGDLRISSTPAYPIRGHQLGYRPKTNAYDAWTVEQFDRYIRDLAIFGANSIEIMPPLTDDVFDNEHMVLPAIDMIQEQSRIGQKYGLDVWMWYPNLGTDFTSSEAVERELKDRDEVFSLLPKLDAVFVPGGDPGRLHPKELFPWLEKMAGVLQKHHPRAKIWISPQSATPTEDWYRTFFEEVNKGYPWLGGVVYGPWVKKTIREVRELVRKDLPIRRYPDITHSTLSQYPVQEWDLAYVLVLGRECYNPRPESEKHIHNLYKDYAVGSLSYSEGINDDVNKFIWSGQDWDPSTPVTETLRDFARFFIGPDFTEEVTQGLLALEHNFRGPLLVNSSVENTLRQWQEMEEKAPADVLGNYRFQMGLIRAYFDAHIRRRLIYETELEQMALDVLLKSEVKGTLSSLQEAERILNRAIENPVRSDLRDRCFALADSLFRSIRSQLTVHDPQAGQKGRGNFLDFIDLPLNNRLWLNAEFKKIRTLASERERLEAIRTLTDRKNPGPGGFYDNLGGSPDTWRHVVRQKVWEEDPTGLESPFVDFTDSLYLMDTSPEGLKTFRGMAVPLEWLSYLTVLYDAPLIMKYENLDPGSTYRIRVTYTGRFDTHLKLVANQDYVIHDNIITGNGNRVYEFPLPGKVTASGELELTWSCRSGERGTQVSEVWLIKEE